MSVPHVHPAATGEEDFAWFFTAEFPRVVRLLSVVLRDRAAAEDVSQEAFLRLHQHWGRVAAYDEPEAWTRRVALNLAFSVRRRELRRRELEAAGRERGIAREGAPEAHLDVVRAVAALPARQRALVALYHLEDRPLIEVAELMGMREGAAKVALHRARKRLAELLDDSEVPR